MKLIHTTDGNAYRRWINFVLCFIIPGSAQFLSGRKRAGVFWFLGYLAVTAGVLAYVLHPETALCVVSYEPLQWITFPLLVAMIADGIRRPIKRRPLKEWAVFISLWGCLTLLPAFGMRTYLVQPFKIPTGAMEPTILGNRLDADGNHVDGDRLFVNKLIYRHTEPRRGDVIVFRTKGLTTGKQDTCYIKRLVGLPGETLRIDPPFVVVNGVRLSDPPIFREISEKQNGFKGFCLAYSTPTMGAYLTSPTKAITLGADEFLVMGDNSQNSLDGRHFGAIKRDAILGKAFYIYAPADRKGWIR